MYKAQYITKIEAVDGLSAGEKIALKRVTDVFPFRANEYYLSLIDWSDPNDPIRKIVIPQESELKVWGKIDASNESTYTVVPGCEHKYADTAILLSNHVCGCFCRFCFRKRLFIKGAKEVPADLSMGLEYIRKHEEINNVLITGGDGLLLSTGKLEKIIKALCEMDHVRIIRIGSKILAFNPFRVLNDPDLPKMLGRYSGPKRQIYVITHFNHPKEITPKAVEAIEILKKHGIVLANQTPLLKGINDDPDTLGRLFNELSFHGVPPYYVFINRPVIGNREFSLSLREAYEIFEEARNRCSGLGKRARLAMSHETGKVELLGVKDDDLILRYQRFVKISDKGRIFSIEASNDVYWLDGDLNPLHFEDSIKESTIFDCSMKAVSTC